MNSLLIFILISLAFLLLAFWFAVLPFLRRGGGNIEAEESRRADNIAAGRRRLRAAEQRAAAGEISAEQKEETILEIENQLLRDLAPAAADPVWRADYWAAAAAFLLLAVAPPLLYVAVGAPEFFSPQAERAAAVPPPPEELARRLEARLAEDPSDSAAAYWLGRLLSAQGDFAAAAEKFRQAREIAGMQADIIAAEAMARMQMPDSDAEVRELLTAGLKEEKEHTHLLWLAALHADNLAEFDAAEEYRRRARASMWDLPEAESEGEIFFTAIIKNEQPINSAAASLAVFARVDDEPPAPLAVVRAAADFPATVQLRAAAADFPRYDIIARVFGGGADWVGEARRVAPGAAVTITINRRAH